MSSDNEPIGLTQYGSPDVDLEQIEEMLSRDPENEGLLAIAAFAYYSEGQIEKSLVAYQKLISIDFKNPEFHYCLGNSLYRLGRNEEAYQEWKITMSLDKGGRYGKRAEKRVAALGHGN